MSSVPENHTSLAAFQPASRVAAEPLRILVSAGERSGEMHLAEVLRRLARAHPQAEFRGMGGEELASAGVKLEVDYRRSGGVMGFVELFGSVGKVLRALSQMKRVVREWRPDLVLLVDYPDFNLRLARYAKRAGSRVVYFIPPKVWAWRTGRVELLKRHVDAIASILPFEPAFYAQHGVSNIRYVGNPTVEAQSAITVGDHERSLLLEELGIDPTKAFVALLPGSRRSEIRAHLPVMFEAWRILSGRHPALRAVLCVAPTLDSGEIAAAVRNAGLTDSIILYRGDARRVMALARVGMIKCGTSALEAACAGLPSVVFFKMSLLSEWIVRRSIRVSSYSLANLIVPGAQPEVIQDRLTPQRLADEVDALLHDSPAREVAIERAKAVRAACIVDGATVADRVVEVTEGVRAMPRRRSGDTVRALYRFLKPYRRHFAGALFLMVCFGATDGLVPLIIKNVLDGVFAQQNREWLYVLPGIVVVFACIRATLDYGQQYLMSRVGHWVVRDIRDKLNANLLQLSGEFYLRQSVGSLLTRFTSDVVLVRSLLTDALSAVLRDTVRIAALIVTALYLDLTLAAIALVVFPVAVIPIVRFGKRMRRLGREGQDALGAMSGQLQETMLGHRVVKIFGREDHETERFARENARLTSTMVRSEHVRALSGPINEVLASFAVAGVILYGGLTVINGVRSQGEFLAFLVSMFLLYDPLKKLSRVNAVVQQGIAGGERVLEVLEARPSVREPERPLPMSPRNDIQIDGVTFGYAADKPPALRDVTLRVAEGTTVALVGLSGSGKSTLVDLVPRFIDPQHGVVSIGGVDVSRVALNELRARVALVSQHTFLFNDSIFRNIAYGTPGDPAAVTREQVEAAARAAFADDFIRRLPRGYETVIGEAGLSLSGGERQRIAIARAILKDAPILILDEATASLDNQSEREVQLALERLQRGRTTIVIAHRLSTVRNADRIVVMRDGAIVEEGTHDDLLARKGDFFQLYSMQFHGG